MDWRKGGIRLDEGNLDSLVEQTGFWSSDGVD